MGTENGVHLRTRLVDLRMNMEFSGGHRTGRTIENLAIEAGGEYVFWLELTPAGGRRLYQEAAIVRQPHRYMTAVIKDFEMMEHAGTGGNCDALLVDR